MCVCMIGKKRGGLGVKGKGLEEERGDRRGGRGRRGRGRGDKKKRNEKVGVGCMSECTTGVKVQQLQ